jgi:hypothetical protein
MFLININQQNLLTPIIQFLFVKQSNLQINSPTKMINNHKNKRINSKENQKYIKLKNKKITIMAQVMQMIKKFSPQKQKITLKLLILVQTIFQPFDL